MIVFECYCITINNKTLFYTNFFLRVPFPAYSNKVDNAAMYFQRMSLGLSFELVLIIYTGKLLPTSKVPPTVKQKPSHIFATTFFVSTFSSTTPLEEKIYCLLSTIRWFCSRHLPRFWFLVLNSFSLAVRIEIYYCLTLSCHYFVVNILVQYATNVDGM